jgi:hypothetical protein
LIILVVISLFEMKRRKRIRRRRNNRHNKTILPMSNAYQTQKGNLSLAKNSSRCDDRPVINSNIKIGAKSAGDMKVNLQKPITQNSERNVKNAIDIEDTKVTKADDTVVKGSSSDEMISVLVMSGSSNHSQNSSKSIKIAQSATVSNDIDNTTDEMIDVKSASSSKSEECTRSIKETKSTPDEIILVKAASSALSSEIETKDIIAAESGEMTAEECTSSTNSIRSTRSSKRTRSDKSVKQIEKVTVVTATSSDEIVLVESASSSQMSVRSAASAYSESSLRMIGVERKKNEATILSATCGDQSSMNSSSRSKPSERITGVTEKANEAVNDVIAPTDDIVIVESASSSQYS